MIESDAQRIIDQAIELADGPVRDVHLLAALIADHRLALRERGLVDKAIEGIIGPLGWHLHPNHIPLPEYQSSIDPELFDSAHTLSVDDLWRLVSNQGGLAHWLMQSFGLAGEDFTAHQKNGAHVHTDSFLIAS